MKMGVCFSWYLDGHQDGKVLSGGPSSLVDGWYIRLAVLQALGILTLNRISDIRETFKDKSSHQGQERKAFAKAFFLQEPVADLPIQLVVYSMKTWPNRSHCINGLSCLFESLWSSKPLVASILIILLIPLPEQNIIQNPHYRNCLTC